MFTLRRSGCSRWTDLGVHHGPKPAAEGELREAGRGQQALVDAQKLETFDPASSEHKGREMEGIEGPERHRGCHPPCEVAHRRSQLPEDTTTQRGGQARNDRHGKLLHPGENLSRLCDHYATMECL